MHAVEHAPQAQLQAAAAADPSQICMHAPAWRRINQFVCACVRAFDALTALNNSRLTNNEIE
jgi:hypothetical protein